MSKNHATNYCRPRLCRWLSVTAGFVLVGAAFLLELIAEEGAPLFVQSILVGSGCTLAALGLVFAHRQLGAALAKVSLVILSLSVFLVLGEVTFRAAGYDFSRLDQPGDDVPIFYRRPTVHAGEGIFRRAGPASWRGKVLCAYMRMHGSSDAPYAGERPVVAEYDASGFRNPTELTDWEVVVTGDSFVELGYLPYADLFTTIAAQRLGVRIKNLGVSGTGPLSQAFYVKHYGQAPSTKAAVLCFFEGNDLEDLKRELRHTEFFRVAGHPAGEDRKQVSLLKALYERVWGRGRAAELLSARVIPNAALVTGDHERPMTVYRNPPVWDQLSPEGRKILVRALANWANTVRSKEIQPWVLYLPDSHRVFHGLIRFADTNSVVARWKPGDFAAHLGATCTNLDIGFIDTFPALRQAAEAGGVPYNLVGDCHLSLEGSRLVAGVLADGLKTSHLRSIASPGF